MSGFHGSTTPVEIRNFWRTPDWLHNPLDLEFDFGVDVAASADNTRVKDAFITKEMNALSDDIQWIDYVHPDKPATAWCNPPYDDIYPWMVKAEYEARFNKLTTVLLVPNTPDAAWWPRGASEIRFLTGFHRPGNLRNISGRVCFVRADTGEVQRGQNKGSVLIIFAPYSLGNMTTKYIGIETFETGAKK